MKLDEYMSARPRGERTRLARALGCSLSFVSQMISGESRVPDDALEKVIAFSNGLVSIEDLRPDVDWAFLRGKKVA